MEYGQGIIKARKDDSFHVFDLYGMSTNTKPTLEEINTGSSFYCVDTKESFIWYIDNWYPA